MREAQRDITIVNQRGLHARASAKFVEMVMGLPADISVTVSKGDNDTAGGSILGLMMLGAAKDETITIHVSGPDAEGVLEQLVQMVSNGFGEE